MKYYFVKWEIRNSNIPDIDNFPCSGVFGIPKSTKPLDLMSAIKFEILEHYNNHGIHGIAMNGLPFIQAFNPV